MMDKYVKFLMIGMGIIFLILFYQYANNGRYQCFMDKDGDIFTAFDTQSGTFYSLLLPSGKDGKTKGSWAKFNPISRARGIEVIE